MANERRDYVKKCRMNEREVKQFYKNALRSGEKNEAEFMRKRLLYSDRQLAKQNKLASQYDAETREGLLKVCSEMYMLVNQCKAGVNVKDVAPELEREVNTFWQLLK